MQLAHTVAFYKSLQLIEPDTVCAVRLMCRVCGTAPPGAWCRVCAAAPPNGVHGVTAFLARHLRKSAQGQPMRLRGCCMMQRFATAAAPWTCRTAPPARIRPCIPARIVCFAAPARPSSA